MTDKSESRIPGINVQVTNELQTLYSDQINLSNKEIKTKKVDNFSTAPIGLFGYAFCCYIVGLGKLGIIEFDLDTKTICASWFMEQKEITIDELRAINKQCKELGWL